VKIRWTESAKEDLARLEAFLRPSNVSAAARAVTAIVAAPEVLLRMPRMGSRVEGFDDREVRRILSGNYEIQYEVLPDEIAVLRVFHTKEDR
jgi:plasmid stabilization system protein ParE